jgi:tetratricopeptide (TPR) repeat protein/predicted nucleic acid-binding Zn ribbon protein
MRFCPYCGAPVVPAGKFCVECGRQLGKESEARGGRIRGLQFTAAFVGVFLAILVVGLLVVYLVVPGSQQEKLASVPPPQASPAAEGQQSAGDNLPPGHPKVEIPAEARHFIDQVEQEANASPNDLAKWNRLGEVSMRAAMMDPAYYAKAETAYAHALKLDPDSPDALRGIGNLNYDHKNYDQAIAAYEHYLKLRPDDPEVRTDLGTMYLYTNNPDQAVVQYKRAIKAKPDFFEAYFNMGIAYGDQNDMADARQSLQRALKLAPDDSSKSRVQEVLSKLGEGPGPKVAAASPPNAPGAAPTAAEAGTKAAANAPGSSATPGQEHAALGSSVPPEAEIDTGKPADFHGAVEQMVRAMPIAGPKVAAVHWPEKFKAMVMMNNFPMDGMPPFIRQKFLNDLKDRIKTAKASHNVSGTVVVDIADGATGEVMESVSQ